MLKQMAHALQDSEEAQRLSAAKQKLRDGERRVRRTALEKGVKAVLARESDAARVAAAREKELARAVEAAQAQADKAQQQCAEAQQQAAAMQALQLEAERSAARQCASAARGARHR